MYVFILVVPGDASHGHEPHHWEFYKDFHQEFSWNFLLQWREVLPWGGGIKSLQKKNPKTKQKTWMTKQQRPLPVGISTQFSLKKK